MTVKQLSPSHILVVDDHADIRHSLAKYLETTGFRATTAANASEARKVLATAIIDLIILDIMMPGEDGLTLCRELQVRDNIPVILLTAMSEDTDMIIGLEMGADDYVSKPFNPRELLARIRAVLRRSSQVINDKRISTDKKLYYFDRWRFNVSERSIAATDGDKTILSTGEFLLLLALIERPHQVLSRDQLLDLTRGREAQLFDRSIDNQISRLRKKLELNPKEPRIIQTHWGGGYSFTAEPTSE